MVIVYLYVISDFIMKMLAKVTAIFLPVAVPCVVSYFCFFQQTRICFLVEVVLALVKAVV